ncbi:ankyrin repeat-containing domain protein, partial [Hyaloscypha sp. PMI_1271]
TPLHVAAERGYEDAARTLLHAGADVSARYHDGRTPLHLAAEHGQVDVIELLLERDAHVMA